MTIKYFLFLFLTIQISCALECHNCFSKSRDLSDCEEVSVKELREKLKDHEKFRRLPSIRIEEFDPDACLMVSNELYDVKQGKVIEVVTVRTQIRQSNSKHFEGKRLNDKCKIQNEVQMGIDYNFNTQLCACNATLCNSGVGLQGPGFYKLIAFILVSLGVMSISL